MQAFSGQNYRRNAEKAGDRTPCVICGKAVTSERMVYVRVDVYNRIHNYWAKLGSDDMGCFRVGPDCLRRYPELKELSEVLE